jgi:hypothetical protein
MTRNAARLDERFLRGVQGNKADQNRFTPAVAVLVVESLMVVVHFSDIGQLRNRSRRQEKRLNMGWRDSQAKLQKWGIGQDVEHVKTITSSVTTAWRVNWDEEFIARDLMQNFFDANRDQIVDV